VEIDFFVISSFSNLIYKRTKINIYTFFFSIQFDVKGGKHRWDWSHLLLLPSVIDFTS
jgi:hypothetical protein